MFLIYLWGKGRRCQVSALFIFQVRKSQKSPTAFIETEEYVYFVTFRCLFCCEKCSFLLKPKRKVDSPPKVTKMFMMLRSQVKVTVPEPGPNQNFTWTHRRIK